MKISGLLVFKDEEKWFLKESVQSFLKICDEIIAIDTGSKDNSVELLDSINDGRIKILYKKQKSNCNKEFCDIRNYGIKFCSGDYIFNFDADEILDDKSYLIKQQLIDSPEVDCWDIQGRHYYWHLNKEDVQVPEHWWNNRLFRNNGNIKYPSGTAHGLAYGYNNKGKLKGIFIHHYGYCKNLVIDEWRYSMNYDNLEMHTKEFLNDWLKLRLTGTFPVRLIDVSVHPQCIKDKFHFERWA